MSHPGHSRTNEAQLFGHLQTGCLSPVVLLCPQLAPSGVTRVQREMALASPSWDADRAVGAVPCRTRVPEALAFLPRLFVLTTLPHRRPQGHRFERVNGWQSLRIEAPRRVGLPYGVYPRLLLMFLATEAVRKRSREIHLGATSSGLAINADPS